MITIKISPLKCIFYAVFNTLHTFIFIAFSVVFWCVEHRVSVFVVFLCTILYIAIAIYPMVFIIYFYLYDRKVELRIDEESNEVYYLDNNNLKTTFNISDVRKITACYPTPRLSINYYNKIYLKSGQVVVVSCLASLRKLKKRFDGDKGRLEHNYWINDFIYNKTRFE